MMKRIALMYHDVYLDKPEESGMNVIGASQYKIPISVFEAQVRTISEYCESQSIDKQMVEFTFDDGGSSFGSYIPEILEKYGFKGIFFISSDFIDHEGFVTSEDVKKLCERGHIVGSHTKTHPEHLEKMEDKDMDNEWSQSIARLSAITNTSIQYASLPNGNGSKRVLESCAKNGITNLYSSEPTTSIKKVMGMSIFGRFVIHYDMSIEEVLSIITNNSYRTKKLLRYKAISFLKLILGDTYIALKSKITGM